MMKRSEKAKELFLKGYNCSQAVLGAFCDVIGFEFDQAMRLASSFGGGVARMRHICGTCSAMFMIAGLMRGYTVHEAKAKSEHYAFIQSMAKEFEARNGSLICRELLDSRAKLSKTVDNGSGPEANERTTEYYRARPCLSIIEDAVMLTCKTLSIPNETE